MSDLPETFVPGFHDEDAVRKMKYVKFGNTGMTVSTLALGTAGFSHLFGEYTMEQCKATVHEAIKKGINYIDTAPYYGNGVSEEILGKALEGIPRKAYYIATKVCRYQKDLKLMVNFTAKKTRESIEASLKRLGLGYVDVLQVHDVQLAPSLDIILSDTLPTIEKAKKQGKTRFIGITGYPPSLLAECVKLSPVKLNSVLCYSRLSLLNQDASEFLPFFQSKQMAFVNAAPHCLGLLSNTGPQPWHHASQELKDVCTEAREYCKKNNVELGKLAMFYALQAEGPSTNLVGMNTPELLNTNLDVFYNGLTDHERKVYDHVKNNILPKAKQTHWEGAEIPAFVESTN